MGGFGLFLKVIVCGAVVCGGAYWVLASWFDRRLSGAEAAVLLTGLITFAFLSVPLALKGSPNALALLLALVAVALALFRYYSQTLNARALDQMDADDIATYQAALDLDPNNVAAHSLLAKIYRKQGQWELALRECEAALKLDPSLQEERYWAGRLRSRLELGSPGEVRCHQCGATGPLVAGRCQGCGESLQKPSAGGT